MSMRIRVINTSQLKSHGGMFLDMGEDHKNFLIAVNKFWQGEVTSVPQHVLEWQEQGLARVVNADTGVDLGTIQSAQMTPGQLSPFREMPGIDPKGQDPFDEDEPDLTTAVDAVLPPLPAGAGRAALGPARRGAAPGPGQVEGAHMPERPGRPAIAPHHQYDRARASQGVATVDTSQVETNNELSPIPGEVPHSLDNSAAFTIKAPRYVGPGAVISTKR